MAKAICGADAEPLLFEQALIIAENAMLLHCVATERVAVIERLRDITAMPLAKRDTLTQARARQAGNQARLRRARPDEGRIGNDRRTAASNI
jgi:hypothetical protein